MLPFLATILIIPTFPAYVLSCSQISLILACCLAYPSFYILLFISIGSYRLSPFHPLANYPGPTIAKISKVWTVHKSMDGKLAHYYKMLHDQYGPIVRVGPNEISVAEKDLLPFIIGTQGMPKGPLWEGRAITPKKNRNQSNYSLIGVRDLTHHSHLRKTWNRAFSEEPLQDYQDILIQNANNLVEVLEKRFMEGSVELDIANVINLFSFDFMGDLAFAANFDALRNNDANHFQKNMERALLTPALTMQIPWSVAIVQAFPWLSTSLRSFGAFAVSQAKLRASNESRKDLFYYLRSYSDVPQDSLFAFIVSNAVLAIIAGSDTSASALCNAIYYLVANPKDMQTLQQEIEEAFPDSGTNIDIQKLDKMPWLNAVINETLRLQPPVPSGLQRAPAVGSKGKLVGSHYIKEGTSVLVSPYVLHRDPRYFFPHPDKYWPARWLPENADSVTLDTSAFIPFSQGPANCVGKRLAMFELRYLLVLLFSRYEFSFQTGWDAANWERGLKDQFVLAKDALKVTLTHRTKKN
ncbi:high nitrogen upregulated cytochrome P450 monooxygenase 2 [Lentinula edodes]|nr:high nitrogen upregulated cytochrome P450 monooxygenase 2 [Lentinula edodes]